MSDSCRILVILGPTASGKTQLAVSLASRFNGEIISADSRQVFRGMDIGTGKDLSDYQTGSGSLPVHLIDCRDPDEEYDLYHFQKDARRLIVEITERNRLPVVCGGTGLYLSALLQNYQLAPAGLASPDWNDLPVEKLADQLSNRRPLHNTTDTTDRNRLVKALSIAQTPFLPDSFRPINSLVIGIRWPRQELYERIGRRLRSRMQAGMVEETRHLIENGIPPDRLRFFGLEYKWLTDYVEGRISLEVMETGLFQAIRKFAKRQETWFRKMEREGVAIHWIDGPSLQNGFAGTLVEKWLQTRSSGCS